MAARLLHLAFCIASLALLTNSGCVSRRLTIRTDPPGALVEVDGRPLGLSPVSTDFTYYGEREITLSAPGYKTKTILQPVPTPWYQIPPLDFISDNFLFRQVTDRHEFVYPLEPYNPGDDDEEPLKDRARNFRSQAQSGS